MLQTVTERAESQQVTESVGRLALRYVKERKDLGQFAETTAREVRFTVWRFACYVGTDQPPTKITPRLVERWMLAQRVAPSSLRARYSRVRMFIRWLVTHGYLRHDPTARIKPPRQPRYLPRGLPLDDLDRLVDQTTDPRLRVMILLMAREGLRCCEVSAAQLGDLDFDTHTLIVRGKGGHQRRLPVSDQSWDAIEVYLRQTRASAGPLIRSASDPHRGINAKRTSRVVAQAMRAVGVPGSAHALRHSFARGMVDRGADIRAVRDALGHRSLTTTSMYIGATPPEMLREAMNARPYGRRSRP